MDKYKRSKLRKQLSEMLLRQKFSDHIKKFIFLIVFTVLLYNYYDSAVSYKELKNEILEHEDKYRMFKDYIPLRLYSKMLREYKSFKDLPTLFLITPTSDKKLTTIADLTRLRNTLWLVPKIFWIIIEDAKNQSSRISKFLKKCNIPYVHLVAETPAHLISKPDDKIKKVKGAIQRNAALEWIRDNFQPNTSGVVYFADDDNSYDIRLFEAMRDTKKVSVWLTGLVGRSHYEGPICENGQIVGFACVWGCNRKFPLDMASFAVNLNHVITNRKIRFDENLPKGYLETEFLTTFAEVIDLEPKGECKEVMVWHTKTMDVEFAYHDFYKKEIMENV